MKPQLGLADFQRAAARLGCSVAAIRAVAEVESPRGGFNPNGTLTTLFEAHHFHRLTKGKWTDTHPHLSSRSWNRALYGKNWTAERDRLAQAAALDPVAAIMSTSWGMFQIMGFNHAIAGHRDAADMVNAFAEGEPQQLDGFVSLIESWGLADELQGLHDFDNCVAFALRYNGPRARENKYPEKIAMAYARYKARA